jgi:hypothetical protein
VGTGGRKAVGGTGGRQEKMRGPGERDGRRCREKARVGSRTRGRDRAGDRKEAGRALLADVGQAGERLRRVGRRGKRARRFAVEKGAEHAARRDAAPANGWQCLRRPWQGRDAPPTGLPGAAASDARSGGRDGRLGPLRAEQGRASGIAPGGGQGGRLGPRRAASGSGVWAAPGGGPCGTGKEGMVGARPVRLRCIWSFFVG